MKIIIIGRGRLGKSLVHFLEESPFEVQLQGHLDTPQITEHDIVWLTVPDDSIFYDVSKNLPMQTSPSLEWKFGLRCS